MRTSSMKAVGFIFLFLLMGCSSAQKNPREIAKKVMRGHSELIRECYQEGIDKTRRKLKATFHVLIVTDNYGNVIKADFTREQNLDPELKKCITGTFSRLVFPRGRRWTVIQPYRLSSKVAIAKESH